MRKLTIGTTVLFFVLTIGLFAQSNTEQEPVSKSDLKGVTEQMRSELRRLDKKAVERDAVLKEEARRQNEEILRKNTEAQEKLQAKLAEGEAERKQAEALRDKKMNNIIYGVAGVGLLIALVCGVILVRGRTKAVDVRVVRNHQKEDNGILVDPEAPALKRYSEDNGSINPVPFRMSLREGTPLCMAELIEGKKPLIVSIDGRSCKIGWDDRQKKVGKFLSEIQNKVAS